MQSTIYVTPDSIAPKGKAPSVLVIDDFETHIELMGAILEQEGYRVISSSSGPEVLKVVDELDPDMAVLDVMMPEMNGYELCRSLKGKFNKKYFPVILVTGLNQTEDRLNGIEAGADDFFSKPFNPREITAKIRSLLKLKQLQDELDRTEDVILSLAAAIEAKDIYTKGHSERVSALAVEVSWMLSLQEKEILVVKKGGLLHDIGKIGLTELVLHKNGPLTQEELNEVRRHPITGVNICSPLNSLKAALPVIRHHHERWDGCGFPDGLKGEAIPLGARIVGIADAFDAMVSKRPYRPGYAIAEALFIMKGEADAGQWDPYILKKFFTMVERSGVVEKFYSAK